MTESFISPDTRNKVTRTIRLLKSTHLRCRSVNERVFDSVAFGNGEQKTFYDDSLQWIANNYIRRYGLRNWCWRIIIAGICEEHIQDINNQDNSRKNKIKVGMIKSLWQTFVMVSGIRDFEEVPNTEDPEHPHVKTALFIYSLQSFLFQRIN